jgi:hypothetical protein
MPRNLFTPGTMPAPSRPDPLLLFIQRAQLEIYYDDRGSQRQWGTQSPLAKKID